ncbi:3-deoxy-D-manno-octulosonate cytidylyltransferase [Chthonomonas calidirosea]|uniref:3-deoxy-manno-octulosonate cytidylyltransferase n=1 Tax=Chthonomonas calidirosea TaxID=454171 RepID=UPI0006DD3F2B|nr:3-deoxy-manno-octulosonate cytidylyltransferase [Chthonomonas calidirosea]CEK16181.1 3-deoxy-D-manno-octulosonate cytidylyltransferase [Chthonomonas calidirosea]CEK16182.1 3-deoxy-D-manno-octulosonate cytidylyltransferase [Chthonomonas calidirosea]
MLDIVGIIPARLAATRLPNKPLADIGGQPMIVHVWQRAQQSASLQEVWVATPDAAIVEVVEKRGGKALLTSKEHRTGTDRVAEAARLLGLSEEAIVVNIQGDEPLLEAESIDRMVELLRADLSLDMASVMCPCPQESWEDPACVKVVCGRQGDALYFSRSRIPYPRQEPSLPVMQHIGLYAYRNRFLQLFTTLEPTPLECTESLEQLRALEWGYRIRMARVERAPIAVDTPEDLEKVRQLLKTSPPSLE